MSVNALAAAGDVAIAVSMCTLLHTSRTGFRKFVENTHSLHPTTLTRLGRSDAMINGLIIYSLNTGASLRKIVFVSIHKYLTAVGSQGFSLGLWSKS